MKLRAFTQGQTLWAQRISGVVLLTLLTRLVGFIYPVVVLRQLPAASAGLAFFFINTGYFVVQPVSGGPATAMIRQIAVASDDDERAQWLRAALSLAAGGVALCIGIGATLCLTTSAPLFPMLVVILGLSADIIYFQFLTARHRYAWSAGYRLISNVAQLAVLLIALALGMSSVLLVVAVFAASYVVGFSIVEARERVFISMIRRGVQATARHRHVLLRAAIPTALTGLAYASIVGFDTYLVRLNRESLVPTYGAAKTLAGPLLLVSFAVTTIVQPEAATLGCADAKALRRRMLIMAAPVAAVAVLIAVALAGPVIHLLYGSRYPAAVATFRWLAAGTSVLSVYTLLQSWCYGRGYYRAPLLSLAAGACAAVATNLLLLPRFGAPGAAMGVLVGSSVACVLLLMFSSDLRFSLGHSPTARKSSLRS
jgi:O-antigen/teichoic acid export membrane protein